MNKFLTIMCGCWSLCCLSCMQTTVEDYDLVNGIDAGVYSFDGTIYDFISQKQNSFGVTFHSLNTILDYEEETPIDGEEVFNKFAVLKSRLDNPKEKFTLLAVSDANFDNAFRSLNRYRKSNGMTDEVQLENLFSVRYVDRIVETDKHMNDVVRVKFDYRKDLDSLVCRYIIPGIADTKTLEVAGGDSILNTIDYDYRMHLAYKRMPASGYVESGIKHLDVYDMSNTLQDERWVLSPAKWIDIKASNGVIHIMNDGHEFGFESFTNRFKNYGHEK